MDVELDQQRVNLKRMEAMLNNDISEWTLEKSIRYGAIETLEKESVNVSIQLLNVQGRASSHEKEKMTVATTFMLPVIDLNSFISDPNSLIANEECKRLAKACIEYGAFAVRDNRVTEEANSQFLNLMEDYFDQDTYAKENDCRPELSYQVGATPALTELPRCGRDDDCKDMVNAMEPHNRPASFDQPDPKWRFFWRMGVPPVATKFAQLNADPVIPEAFPQWQDKMNSWGGKLLDAVEVVAQMLAVGLGLDASLFVDLAKYGPHLLAPTGSDLITYGKVGTVLAGFHADLNFITIHGKSRFPGLHIWTRSGKKLLAKIPDGCLLAQAGKQLEYVTGGAIKAGFHEVVVVPETLEAMERQKTISRPLWRISSTLFYHLASDHILQPLAHFKTADALKAYPAQFVGTQVQKELGFLELSQN